MTKPSQMSETSYQGKSIQDWVIALKDPRSQVHSQACDILAAIGPPAVPFLVEVLKDKGVGGSRALAASVLMSMGPKAGEATPALAETLADSDEVVRLRAAQALVTISPLTKGIMPVLIDSLSSTLDWVRADAATIIGWLGRQGQEAEPALRAALKDNSEAVRRAAAEALEKIAPELRPKSLEQKLVTVFLHDSFDQKKGSYGDPAGNSLFGVSEHLAEYLKEGWTVKEFKTLGGAGGRLSGWIIVLLEKLLICFNIC